MFRVVCKGSCHTFSNEVDCDIIPCAWRNETGTCENVDSESLGETAWIGIILALVGNIIINAGMNSMKHAHNINQDEISKEPVKHFSHIPWWWFGIFGIIGGEVGNLVAYGYAPAAIVTPIGAIGVLTNVLITTFILKERVTKLNILGMMAVVCGIVVTVYFAPSSNTSFSSEGFWNDVIATKQGIVYFAVFAVGIVIMIPINRYFGHKTVVIPVLASSIFGSLTILSAKTFSSLLTKAVAHGFDKYFLSPVPYLAFLLMLATCIATMAFINTAMTRFGNSKVVPTYYAFFTTFSVASVGFVFREFDCFSDPRDVGLFVGGIFCAICGVGLVQLPASSKVSVAIEPMKDDTVSPAAMSPPPSKADFRPAAPSTAVSLSSNVMRVPPPPMVVSHSPTNSDETLDRHLADLPTPPPAAPAHATTYSSGPAPAPPALELSPTRAVTAASAPAGPVSQAASVEAQPPSSSRGASGQTSPAQDNVPDSAPPPASVRSSSKPVTAPMAAVRLPPLIDGRGKGGGAEGKTGSEGLNGGGTAGEIRPRRRLGTLKPLPRTDARASPKTP